MKQNNKITISNKMKYTLLLISFIGGGSVMFCELIGAKLVAPYFGTSLYVWAAAIGITLAALSIGYFLGGEISKKINSSVPLFWILLSTGILVLFMSVIGKAIMSSTLSLSVQSGATFSLLIFMAPPLILFGIISPVIIKLLTVDVNLSGKISGLVFAVSTIGGIIFTFLTGFYFLPNFGIKVLCLIWGSFLIVLSMIFLLINKKYFSILPLILVLLIYPPLSEKNKTTNPDFKIIYESEGILGQIRVVDYSYNIASKGWCNTRSLLVNNVIQTMKDKDNPDKILLDYIFYCSNAASLYPKGSDILILGVGGGALLNQYIRMGFNVDAVEYDQRIKEAAIRYFYVNPQSNIFIDDARHFIKTTTKKYDIINFDVFYCETPPVHLLTTECFKETKNILKPKGVIMLNFYGFTSDILITSAKSIYYTLQNSGYNVKALLTPAEKEENRNMLFLASLSDVNYFNMNYSEPNYPKITNIETLFFNLSDLSGAYMFTDDKPILEHLYIPAAIKWRSSANNFFTKNL